jgi:hypothetical protein
MVRGIPNLVNLGTSGPYSDTKLYIAMPDRKERKNALFPPLTPHYASREIEPAQSTAFFGRHSKMCDRSASGDAGARHPHDSARDFVETLLSPLALAFKHIYGP